MFCNACGSKLNKEDKKCRACGAPADQGEACGGFWGLVGEKPTVTYLPPVPPAPPVKKPDPSGSARVQAQPVPEKKSPMKLWYGLIAVLALLLAVQTIRLGVLNRELEDQEFLADRYREWYDQTVQENELLNKQLEGVTGDLQTLSDDVAQIKEILEPTETTEPQEPEETVPEDTGVPGESEASQETAATEENTTPESQPEETVEETN